MDSTVPKPGHRIRIKRCIRELADSAVLEYSGRRAEAAAEMQRVAVMERKRG
jgi:hypothetical protein